MAYRFGIFLILLSCYSQYVWAQKPSQNSKAQQQYTAANRHLRLLDYNKALTALEAAVAVDPTFATAYQQIGDIHRKQENYAAAVKAYEQVLALDPSLTRLTYFGLGESYLFSGKYQEASLALQQYAQSPNLSDKSKSLVKKYLQDIEFSLSALQKPTEVQLIRMPSSINSSDNEYFPKLTADNKKIIFTRKTNNQENFFESDFDGETWSEARKLIGQVNSEAYNEGAHCISPDGKYLFFTGCNWPQGLGSCDIYVSKKENDRWSEPFNLGAPLNSKGWEAQPAISADGKTLYFVSNRPGGYGGYDIWKSTLKEDGSWSPAVNLGPEINTPYDESSPYIHADNKTLYFSSNGWPGFGQYDIFLSQLNEQGKWSTPQNLGRDINNYRNQTSLYVSMNGSYGVLSAEDEYRNQDLYSFTLASAIRPQPVAYIRGNIRDAISGAGITAQIQVTNTATNQLVFEDWNDVQDASFLATLPLGANYAVHIQKPGYLFYSEQYDLQLESLKDEEFYREVKLSPIAIGTSAALRNVYFNSNEANLLPASLNELQKLAQFLKLNPQVSIELSGHTDHTGSPKHNLELSLKRAQAVQRYLIEQQIPAARIQAQGYAATQPLASNETEDGKRMNRRTEFKILSL